MPYQALERPSPALGILSATARQAGISTLGLYPGFRFASRIGLEMYRRLEGSYLNLLGEWTFAGAAFPYAPDTAAAYYELITAKAAGRPLPPLEQLLEIRREAAAFVREEALRILDLAPRAVACGSQFQQHCASLALLREIKCLSPQTLTILGGQCCSGDQGLAVHEHAPWVDFVFSGEADRGLPRLLRLAFEHGADIPREMLPPGVIARSGHHTDVHGSPLYAIEHDLDDLPAPDHDDYFCELGDWEHKGGMLPYLAFEGGRGCDWAHKTGGCTFCATVSERAAFRPKSGPHLLRELFALKEKYGTVAFEAADEMCSPAFFEDFFPTLAAMNPPPFLLAFDIRATLREEQVQLLRRAGCVWLQPGIESLSAGALKAMRKGITPAIAIRLLRLNLENGISTSWNILRGFPGELPAWYDEIAQLAPALAHLEPPHACGQLRIDRNSLYHQKPDAFGLRLRPAPYYAHLYPLPADGLARIASFFENEGDPTGLPDFAPSIQALTAAITAWKGGFENPATRPMLVIDQTTRTVRDTRPCAREAVAHLTEDEARLLAFCRDPQPQELQALTAALARAGVDEKCGITKADALPTDSLRVEAARDALLERRFLVAGGGSLISVVAHPPRYPLPTPEDIFAGNVAF